MAIDPVASHASWMENFPWTRLADVIMPDMQKPMSDLEHLRQLDPRSLRDYLKTVITAVAISVKTKR